MPAPGLSTIGGRLRWAREAAGLSLGQLRAHLGIGRIPGLEDGTAIANDIEIVASADLYDVHEPWLRTGEERPISAGNQRMLDGLSENDRQIVRDVMARAGFGASKRRIGGLGG